jgi:GNAT superfamily N-acetyltransferase
METGIREARDADAPELARLSTQLGYPSTPDDIRRRLAYLLSSNDHRVFVAVDAGDRTIGWVHAAAIRQLENDRHVDIAGLVVADGCRSSGIGGRLLAAAEEWAAALGLTTVRVRSNVVRERAHRFYLRAGYELLKTSYVFTKQIGERLPGRSESM